MCPRASAISVHRFFVYDLHGATNLNRTFAELKSEIETVEDPKHREIGRAMALLVSSLEVGPDADRLIEYTWFSPDFVRNIRDRMTEAVCGQVTLSTIRSGGTAMSLTALGLLSRRVTPSTTEFVDKRTSKVVAKGRREGE